MKLLIPQLLLIATVTYLLLRSDGDSLTTSFRRNTFDLVIKHDEPHPSTDPPTAKDPVHNPSTLEPSNPSNPSNPQNPSTESHDNPKPGDTTKPNQPDQPSQGSNTNTQPEPTHEEPVNQQPSNNAGNNNIKGTTDDIHYIYQTQGHNESLCQEINQKSVLLCRLGLQNNCKRRHISEELSSWWIICPIYTANTQQTAGLYGLHNNFRDYIKSYGIRFQTVETVFPGQEFQLTRPNHQPEELQYHTDWIFAMRENLVNVGIKHLPNDWQYMSWVDQHIYWEDPYWFENSIRLMSHHNIVHLLNGNDFWNLKNGTDYHLDGFARIWNEVGDGFESHDPRQCGLAWAMRREIFEELGGLLDICIGTKCDLYQNYAYAGRRYTSQTNGGEYADMIGAWQDHAIKVYDRKLGFLDSKVYHFMHCIEGCKTSEYNLHVWALNRHRFTPSHDLTRDKEGRIQLTGNLPLAKELWTLYGGAPRD